MKLTNRIATTEPADGITIVVVVAAGNPVDLGLPTGSLCEEQPVDSDFWPDFGERG